MLLLLLRHADAGVPDPTKWPGDVERPLTAVGRDTQRRVADVLRRSGISLDALFTSPLLRARQTAEITADVLGFAGKATICDALAETPGLSRIAQCLAAVRGDVTVGLTGHSPWMDETASLLLAGSASGMSIDFPKSGAMVIRTDSLSPGAGQLIAFITPDAV
jgi:phosphohistidine phosphatase